jgi:hypothetical protein
LIFFGQLNYNKMDVSHAILFLENADFVRITGLYFPAKFELIYRGVTVYMSIQAKPLHTTAKLLESGGLGVSRNYPLNI